MEYSYFAAALEDAGQQRLFRSHCSQVDRCAIHNELRCTSPPTLRTAGLLHIEGFLNLHRNTINTVIFVAIYQSVKKRKRKKEKEKEKRKGVRFEERSLVGDPDG
jgi:hypothetical protein